MPFSSHPSPSLTYVAACARLEKLQALDTPAINPVCRTQFLRQGVKTAQTIVLLHGFTNCPQQFSKLGELFFSRGFNVLIPRIPRHGFADRLTDEPAYTSAEELTRFTDEMVDIATGLGDRITVLGLSGGGVMTAWAAQHRAEVDRAIIIAPNFAYVLIPKPFTSLVMLLAQMIPNLFIWWDEKRRMDTEPRYAYPRFSTRALAQVTRLGNAVWAAAQQVKPLAKSVVMVVNEGDEAVDNAMPLALAQLWRARGANVRDYIFPLAMNLKHDLIDPTQTYQQTSVVYPVLQELVEAS